MPQLFQGVTSEKHPISASFFLAVDWGQIITKKRTLQMEAPKCELEFQSDSYCQKHHTKPAASTEIWLKLTPRSLREGWDPKVVATGNDSDLNVVRVSSYI